MQIDLFFDLNWECTSEENYLERIDGQNQGFFNALGFELSKTKVLKFWAGPRLLNFLYRNAPTRGLALSKQNICKISHKKLCDSSIRIEKASNYTMNAYSKSSEL